MNGITAIITRTILFLMVPPKNVLVKSFTGLQYIQRNEDSDRFPTLALPLLADISSLAYQIPTICADIILRKRRVTTSTRLVAAVRISSPCQSYLILVTVGGIRLSIVHLSSRLITSLCSLKAANAIALLPCRSLQSFTTLSFASN